MSELTHQFKKAVLEEDRWLKICVLAVMVLLPAVAILRLTFPEDEPVQLPWAEWYAIAAHYEPQEHAVVITSRAWIMREPCPPHTDLNRNIFVIDTKRTAHIFETAADAPVINRPGAHISDAHIVIRLVDADGERLDIEPERMRVAITCGTRPPMMSSVIPLTGTDRR